MRCVVLREKAVPCSSVFVPVYFGWVWIDIDKMCEEAYVPETVKLLISDTPESLTKSENDFFKKELNKTRGKTHGKK